MSAHRSNTSDAIAAVNAKFQSAFNRQDAASLAALYTENAQLLPPGAGIVSGRKAIEAFWEGAQSMGIRRVELSSLEIDDQGTTAIEIGRVKLFAENGDQIGSPKFLVVWKRENGDWKLHRDVWNSDEAATPQN